MPVYPPRMGIARSLLGSHSFDEVGIVRGVLPRHDGVMLDVGAHYGEAHADFAANGWQVFAFEPDPDNRALLIRRLTNEQNVHVDPRAISEIDHDVVTLYTSGVSTGISTLAPFHKSHVPTVEVPTIRLDTFLQHCNSRQVTFLKVDAEGFDLPVIRTFPWDTHTPLAVVCEFEDRKTLPLGYTFADLGEFLRSKGYTVFVSEWHPIVEYGTKHRWNELHLFPTELINEAAWGNLVAVQPHLAKRTLRRAKIASFRLAVRRIAEKIFRRG